MNRILTTTAVALGTVIFSSTPAWAGATSGWYAGLVAANNMSRFDADATVGGTPVEFDFRTDGVDYGITAGYRHVTPERFFFAVEGDAVLSEAEQENLFGSGIDAKKEHSYGIYFKPGYDTGPVSLFLTFGWQWAEYQLEGAGGRESEGFDGPVIGAGAGFPIGSALDFSLEYNRVELGEKNYTLGADTLNLDAAANLVKASMNYRF